MTKSSPRPCEMCGKTMLRYRNARFCWSCCDLRVRESGAAAAHEAVHRAVRYGELAPARACLCADCGGAATDYDHRDYAKPLDVEPVCRRCNIRRGSGKWLKHQSVRPLRAQRIAA